MSSSSEPAAVSADIKLMMDKEDLLARYGILKKQYDDTGKEIEQIKQELMVELGDAQYGESAMYKISYKSQKRETIDAKRLKAEMPDIYTRYIQTSTSRVLRINKKEGK